MRIDYILKQDAKYVVNSGASVMVISSFPTVCISAKGQDDIFMQGDDAKQFISEVETISNRCKRLNFDIIELALAKPYIDCIWS